MFDPRWEHAAARWLVSIVRGCWWCLLEARPVVQGVFLLRFFVGASFAGAFVDEVADAALWIGAGCWACMSVSTYVLNGVIDVREDRVNGSERPVARGDLSVESAAGAVVALATEATTL